MVYGLVHCEPLITKPFSQPWALAEVPPVYSAPPDGTVPHNPMKDVPHKKFLPQITVARTRHCGCSNLPQSLAIHCLLDGQSNY